MFDCDPGGRYNVIYGFNQQKDNKKRIDQVEERVEIAKYPKSFFFLFFPGGDFNVLAHHD